MEFESYIQKKKAFYTSLLDFLETAENIGDESLFDSIEKLDNLQNKEESISIFQLLRNIADDHHRLPDFFIKFEKIFKFMLKEKQLPISDIELYQIFNNNKGVLLILLENELLRPNQKILSDIMRRKDENNFEYKYYLYSGIKPYISEKDLEQIECVIKVKFDFEISDFVEKCRQGENDLYICSLIRQDSVEEFISYINRTNTSFSKRIEKSIFETNSFLMKKRPTLIEYATFYGSIQIIQYLKYNKVQLTNSLWFFAVHSNNPRLIHFLEENEITPENIIDADKSQSESSENVMYEEIFKESIMYHHIEIADYIKNNFLNQRQIKFFEYYFLTFQNICYFPNNLNNLIKKTVDKSGFYISPLLQSFRQITIPSSVASIGSNSFFGCTSLTEITIPSSVTSIGSYSFKGCSSLTQIIFQNPSYVNSFGANSKKKFCALLKVS